MKNIFKALSKKKFERQDTKVIDAKGIVDHRSIPAGTLCTADIGTYQAWELDYIQQAKNEKTGCYTQFVSTLNKKPLVIFKTRTSIPGQAADQIAKKSFDETLVQVHEEKNRQSMLLWLGILMSLLALIIGLIVLLNMG